MLERFIKSLFKNYERVLITKALLLFIAVGGGFMSLLILAIALMLHYPLYVWCVFGGMVILWVLMWLIVYAYYRVVTAEQRAERLARDNLEETVKLVAATIVEVVQLCREERAARKPSRKAKRSK